MSNEETELLPCPFCLGPAGITGTINGDVGDGYMWRVFCAEENDCPMMPERYAESERTAIQWWNTRTSADIRTQAERAIEKLCTEGPIHYLMCEATVEEKAEMAAIIESEFSPSPERVQGVEK